MSEPALKCENYTLELFIALKISYSCAYDFRGNLEFPDFLQKSFITSTTGQDGCFYPSRWRNLFFVGENFLSPSIDLLKTDGKLSERLNLIQLTL